MPNARLGCYDPTMPLTHEEYAVIQDFSVLYSGGLDSCAVPLIIGANTTGKIELRPSCTSMGPSSKVVKRHTPELQRVLGERVQHHLIDLTEVWNEVGPSASSRMQSNTAATGSAASVPRVDGHPPHHPQPRASNRQRLHLLERRGEYAAMSMAVTREKNAEFYARYNIRYNAPLLDLGISKPEERLSLRSTTSSRLSAEATRASSPSACSASSMPSTCLRLTRPTRRTGSPASSMPSSRSWTRSFDAELRGVDPDQAIEETTAIYSAEEEKMAAVDEQGCTSSARFLRTSGFAEVLHEGSSAQ